MIQVCEFLGFANFYKRFVRDYSKIVAPLTAFTKKYHDFAWDANCNEAFEYLKQAFTSTPVLCHFDPDFERVVETDGSDNVSAGVMSQQHNGILHPVAFFPKQ